MNKTGLLILLFSLGAHADTCGQLAGVRGSGVEILRVQHERKDGVRFAMMIKESSVTPLECDDIVATGKASSARVIFADAKLSVGPETRLEIAQHSQAAKGEEAHVSLLNLTYGKLRALVNRKKDEATGDTVVTKAGPKTSSGPANGEVSFKVHTFSAVAGVRGTDFYVAYDPNQGVTNQATIEGLVEITQAGTNETVNVDGGKQVAVETTAAAVKDAKSKFKDKDLPKELPQADAPVKPLQVVAINETTKEDLRQTSVAVASDKDFTSKKAVETIGQPSSWTFKHEAMPDSLKKIKNEY